jgi:hypothetical protein
VIDPPPDASPDAVSRPTRAATVGATLIVLTIFLTPAVGFFWLRAMSRETADRSALFHAQGMLLRHDARTQGRWPRSWDDLAADFEPPDDNANHGTPSFDELKARVKVNFALDVETILADEATSPRIIWLKGRPDTEAVSETNARLKEILAQRAAQRGKR